MKKKRHVDQTRVGLLNEILNSPQLLGGTVSVREAEVWIRYWRNIGFSDMPRAPSSKEIRRIVSFVDERIDNFKRMKEEKARARCRRSRRPRQPAAKRPRPSKSRRGR